MGYIPQVDRPNDWGPVLVDGTIRVDEIVEGDLVFTSRPGVLQDLCNRAGEPWRHVGLATVHDGVPSITEVSRSRFDIRPLSRVLDVNDEVAIARVEPGGRERALEAARWCGNHGTDEQIYAWHDVMLAGLIATARHYTVIDEREALHRAIDAAAGVIDARRPRGGGVSYTCAAFVAEGFGRAGHPIEIELRLPRSEGARPSVTELIRGRTRPQLRAGRPTPREYGIVLYALLMGMMAASSDAELSDRVADRELDQIRWAMPGDLWRSPTVTERYLVTNAASSSR